MKKIEENSVGARMRYAREKARLGQQEIADGIGVSKRTYIKYEQNESPTKKPMLKEVAVICAVSSQWLLTGSDEHKPTYPAFPKPSHPENKEGSNQLSERYVFVPLYDVQASAGSGAMVHSEQIVDYLAFLRDWLVNQLGLDAKKVMLIKVIGDSMEPTIKDKALLLVNREVDRPSSDAVYVIRQDGDLIVKRIQNLMDGRIEIRSDNSGYKPLIVPADTVKIMGKVVWYGQNI